MFIHLCKLFSVKPWLVHVSIEAKEAIDLCKQQKLGFMGTFLFSHLAPVFSQIHLCCLTPYFPSYSYYFFFFLHMFKYLCYMALGCFHLLALQSLRASICLLIRDKERGKERKTERYRHRDWRVMNIFRFNSIIKKSYTTVICAIDIVHSFHCNILCNIMWKKDY